VQKNTVFNGRTNCFFASQPKRMYVTSQVVHVTEDQGHSFEIISPDLSRNDPKLQEKQADQLRIKQEQKYTLLYSPYQNHLRKGVIWTGSDDGSTYH
jgi:hypothetical protein